MVRFKMHERTDKYLVDRKLGIYTANIDGPYTTCWLNVFSADLQHSTHYESFDVGKSTHCDPLDCHYGLRFRLQFIQIYKLLQVLKDEQQFSTLPFSLKALKGLLF